MEQALQQLGLKPKEAKLYLFLLKAGKMTGAELAKELGESRTNTYMVLSHLAEQNLVEYDDITPVRRFEAANPDALKAVVATRQQEVRQAHTSLSTVFPVLASLHSLGQHKPGVIHLEGLEGYKKSQEDMAQAGEPIAILASGIAPENKQAWEIIEKATAKRRIKGTSARIIFDHKTKEGLDLAAIKKSGDYEVRFWGDEPLEGEITIYGDKIVLTVYQPSLILTVVTNKVLAQTFNIIYDQIWASAKLS